MQSYNQQERIQVTPSLIFILASATRFYLAEGNLFTPETIEAYLDLPVREGVVLCICSGYGQAVLCIPYFSLEGMIFFHL